ncbi:Ltp family lipoprotein [Pseudonocardia sp. EC080610-09]|uniref:Ltp family lipoprotein n=1 Tax=unclassified Pseudonocardia TaxID=2619320 RepID=UPI0035192A76
MLIVAAAAAGTNDGRTESPTAATPTFAPAVVPPTSVAAPPPAPVPNTASAPETFSAAPPEPTTPALSVSRQNAVESAESYLDYSAFSRKGLIDQLEYEEFSTADATYAVDHVTVDWNEQAAKSAKSYMDYSSFSRGSLIDQLEFEGFTAAQAKHGADSVGL